jgi:PAS domain-containing protein/DNA-binding CsgD family transcriptional regulator
MAKKPTYEELKQRVKALEEEVFRLRQAGDALQENEQRMKTILDASPDMIFQVDTELKIVWANRVCREMNPEAIGSYCYKEYPRKEQACEGCPCYRALRTGQSSAAIMYHSSVEGLRGEVYWENIGIPLRDSRGRVTGAVEIARNITKRKRAEEALQKKTYDLGKRVKELNCLYGISRLVEKKGISLRQILQATADLIPSSWQYPKSTCARIIFEGQEFKTQCFKKTIWHQGCNIVVAGRLVGSLEVYYLTEMPEKDEGPFLKEERNLINAIAERLGHIIEHRQAEEALKKRKKELAEKTYSLEETNIALKVLLKRREEDNIVIEEKILGNVKELVLPYLQQLKNTNLSDKQRAYLEIADFNLNDIISPFLHELSSRYSHLTPTEIQVASLIKEGKTTKKIADLTNSTTGAIDFHRKNLRKKLGLRNTKTNLRSHLLSLNY